MNNVLPRRLLKLMLIAGGLFWSATSHSSVALIDQFTVQRNGVNFFTDTFSNGLTPSQETSNYSVIGAFPNGAESGGQLTLNSDWGALTTNAPEQLRRTLGSQLLSNVNPANPGTGLNKSTTIDVNGIFSLVVPSGPLINGYGLQVQDIIFGQGQDRNVELDVQYIAAFGGNVIRFLQQDFVNNTISTLGYVPFVPSAGADQIELNISRPDATNNDFYGAYAFGSGGIFGSLTTFATAGTLFGNTDFVRARFINYTEIPEPGTLYLIGIALAGLAFSRRRKQ
jgi:hypothetical protein